MKRLFLELRGTVKAHDWRNDHIAHFELLSNSTGSARGDNELRLHFQNDLPPQIDVRQLGAVLRHMRIGLENDYTLTVDFCRPICSEPLQLPGGQPARIRFEIVA